MLVYIHVPFCRRKCDYCAFYSQEFTLDGLELYCRTLDVELAYWRRTLGSITAETVYVGGGTPSMLPSWALTGFFSGIARTFALAQDLEWSFECNPESGADLDYLRELRRYGVNRLSLGVQSFSDENLAALGRVHQARQALQAYHNAREAGFGNISLDLIWGLPGQRIKLWMDELKIVVKLAPEHLSAYGLSLEPGTPLAERWDRGEFELPPEDEQARMFVYGAEYLEAHGYLQYEISNFARMGFACRHNIGYWEGEEYLGLGPSAVSCVAGRRWQNPSDLAAWSEAVRAERLDAGAETLSLQARLRELIMLRLRTARGLRLKAYRELTGKDFLREHARLIKALHQNDLIRLQKGYLRLTRTGMLVSNTIIERFFSN